MDRTRNSRVAVCPGPFPWTHGRGLRQCKTRPSIYVSILSVLLVLFAVALASAESDHRQGATAQHNQQIQQQQQMAARGDQTHLSQWLSSHQNMTLQQQEQALRKEPGFNRLAPQAQQRLLFRLRQLDALTPAQRQRTLQRMEALEKLSPAQRLQIGRVMQQMGQLPPERQRVVRRAFLELRDMPLQQRQTTLASEQFQRQFSPQEQQILENLMRVEPYIPLARPAPSTASPGAGAVGAK